MPCFLIVSDLNSRKFLGKIRIAFKGITSQILMIHQIIERVQAKNLKATLLFVDFSKAFNSIHKKR